MPARKKKSPEKPRTLGAAIDALARLRAKRMAAAKAVEDLRSQEHVLQEHVLGLLAKQKLDKGAGKLASVSIKKTPILTVKNWPAFVQWCVDNGAEDCIQRRSNAKTYLEHIDENAPKCPGVEPDTIRGLTVVSR